MIEVLIVDDSAFMRQIFKKNIDKHPEMKTKAIARNGKKALEKIEKDSFDVITLDIEMPKMDGLETLKQLKIKNNSKIPVIMVSALDNKKTVMNTLELGAFDFITKPSGSISLDVDEIMEDLLKKIKAAVQSNPDNHQVHTDNNIYSNDEIPYTSNKYPIIAIGVSSGGPKVLKKIIISLSEDFKGSLIIVQHMPAGFTKTFAQRLDKDCKIKVVEAEDGDEIKKSKAFIAPGGYHLEVEDNRIKLNEKPKHLGVRPCVDYMMESVAKNYKNRVIGIILTGMGKDGAEGMKHIKENNGYGIIQDKKSALVYGMPQAVIDKEAYDEICSLNEIKMKLNKLGKRK